MASSDHAILLKLYNDMTNVTYIHEQTPEQIKILNDDFTEKLKIFKDTYGSIESWKLEITKFEDAILKGKNTERKLRLFDDILPTTAKFNEEIDTKDLPYITDKISDVLMNPYIMRRVHDINIPFTYIFRAKYNGNPCFIKSFFMGTSGIPEINKNVYEQKIYRYIKTRDRRIKPYYEDYFVKLYDAFKIESTIFKDFLTINNVKFNSTVGLKDWTKNDDFVAMLDSNMYIYFIITEDIQGVTYHDFYRINNKNEELITNTLFDILYGIFLMNYRLKIMHNDTHFGNILIKTDLPSTATKYQIDKKEYTREKNYRLCFYDFDLGYLTGEPNPELYDGWVAQNKQSAKDIWTILNSLYRLYPSYNNHFIIENIKIILNNSEPQLQILKKIDSDNMTDPSNFFWNAYCVDNIQDPCVIPHEPEFYPLKVLQRYIKERHAMLGLTEVNAFYKKYIKYKTKYLELKK
jgi:hypothetical protein